MFTDRIIYLDYNATTPVDKQVMDVMLPYFTEKFENPSSKYKNAMDINRTVNQARKTIADFLGANNPDEIIFQGSATESINHAIRGTLKAHPDKKHIVTSQVEHPAVIDTFKDLERDGYDVSYISVDRNGNLNMKHFEDSLKQDTALVSIMYANNETGVIFPIDSIAKKAKQINPEVLFHTDATQAIGKLNFKLNKDDFKNIDLLSMSGHKIYAPKGIGILFIRTGVRLRKFITGGHQELNKRAGTLNVPYVTGLAKAFELINEDLINNKDDKIKELRDYLEKKILEIIPYTTINGFNAPRLSNTSNISFDCIEGESILFQLDRHNICVSSGSACTSGSLDPSHVLRAMNVPITSAHSSIRVSFGRFSSKKDADKIIEVFPPIIARLREMSPFWDKKNNKPNMEVIKLFAH